MADNGSKTEKATPKKRRDERKKGNVFLSQDAVAVATLLGSCSVLWIVSGSIVEQTGRFLTFCLSAVGGTEVSITGLMAELFRLALSVVARTVLPVTLATALCGVGATFAQTRLLVSGRSSAGSTPWRGLSGCSP